MATDGSYVQKEVPERWDFNNGIVVIYDEEGRPWIAHQSFMSLKSISRFGELRQAYGFGQGAYVPHSNDGGHFARDILPKLISGDRVEVA